MFHVSWQSTRRESKGNFGYVLTCSDFLCVVQLLLVSGVLVFFVVLTAVKPNK
jgi:hypothetical protein